MKGILSGQRPDLTPAQIAAVAVAGVPAVSNLLAAFNAVTVNAAQQAALGDVMTWGGVVATALVAGDTGVRAARNAKDARVESTVLAMPGEPAGTTPDLEPEHEDLMADDELVSDEEEFADPPVAHDDGIDVHDADEPMRPEAGQVPVDPDRAP